MLLQKDRAQGLTDTESQELDFYVELGDFLGFSEMPVHTGIQYCLDCAEKYGLPLEDSQCSAEDFDTMPIDDVSIPVCGKCYAEALAKTAAHRERTAPR